MNTTEIAPDVFRISIFGTFANIQFNHFLIRDEDPLLFHTGQWRMFPGVRDAVSKLINLSDLKHSSFTHFESGDCGSLNERLAAAPNAKFLWSQVVALVCVNDFTGRETRGLADGEAFSTGKYRLRYCQRPHGRHARLDFPGRLRESSRRPGSNAKTSFREDGRWEIEEIYLAGSTSLITISSSLSRSPVNATKRPV
jgi:hypothetical protein